MTDNFEKESAILAEHNFDYPRISQSLSPPKNYPSLLLTALHRLATCFKTENCWHPKEATAAERLFNSAELKPVWDHLSSLIGTDSQWFELIVSVFLKPYAFPEHRNEDRQSSLEKINVYTKIAEKAYELQVLLSKADGDWHGCPDDLSEIIEEGLLDKLLLKTLAATTSCEWPKLEYAAQYSERASDTKQAERYAVFRESKSKKPENVISSEKGSRVFIKDIFRRNHQYQNRHKDGLNYDFQADHEKNRYLKKGDPVPPTFEQIDTENIAPPKETSIKSHLKYLKQIIYSMDELSDRWGRPPRKHGNRTRNDKNYSAPIWLEDEHLLMIVETLFPGKYPELSQVERERRTTVFQDRFKK
jgi:hypothetical protein